MSKTESKTQISAFFILYKLSLGVFNITTKYEKFYLNRIHLFIFMTNLQLGVFQVTSSFRPVQVGISSMQGKKDDCPKNLILS